MTKRRAKVRKRSEKGAPAAAPAQAAPATAPRRGLRLVLLTDLAVLAVVLAVAYGNVIFAGRSLVYSNNFNFLDYRFLAANYGPGFEPAATWSGRNLGFLANFHDPGGGSWQWEPGAELLRRSLAHGELPLWNPYVGAGTPEMANLVSTDLFPPYLLMVALGNSVALRNAYALLLLFGGGACTYVFLRRHGLLRVACLFGAVAFMLSGELSRNVGSFIGQSAVCLPPALLLTRLFLERPGRRRGAMLALGYAGLALASFPPVLFGVFTVTGLYALAVVLLELGPQRRWRALAAYAAAVGVSLGLVAFYYLPAAAALRAAPQVEVAYHNAGQQTLVPATFLELVSPVLGGDSEIFVRPPLPEPQNRHLHYVGLLPLLAILLVGWPAEARQRALWLAALTGVTLIGAKLLGVPPVQWIGYLPALREMHFAHYLGAPLGFLLVLLGAAGVEHLARGRLTLPRAAAALAGVAALLLVIRWHAVRNGALSASTASFWTDEWDFVLALAALAGFAVLAGGWLRGRARWAAASAAGLVLLLVVEAVSHTYYPRQRAWDMWRHVPAYVQAIQASGASGRVFSGGGLIANAGAALGIFQLDSMMAINPPRMFELYRRYAAPLAFTFLRQAVTLPPEGVLDRANVELLAIRREAPDLLAQARGRPYTEVFADGFVVVFRRETSPRYYFSSDYRVLNAAQALNALGALPTGRQVLLESPPGFAAQPNLPSDPAVRLVKLRPNRVRLEVDAPRPGVVYCSEADFPGWSARRNGGPAEILRASYAFRAIAVPAGRSVIELRYWPPGLTAGLWVSATCLLGLAVAVALGPRRPLPAATGSGAARGA